MVLRDNYINSVLRCSALLLLMMLSSCGQSSDKPAASTSAETVKAPVRSVITDQVQSIRNELQSVMSEMNAIYSAAKGSRAGNGKEKGEAGDKNAEVVLRKSGTLLGSMFILEGSLSAIEQRFNEGMLDQKQAQEMLNKASIDVQSYKDDVKKYREVLGDKAPVKAEKSEKK